MKMCKDCVMHPIRSYEGRIFLSPTSLKPFQALDSENAEVVATRELGIEFGDAGLAGITDKGRANRIRRAHQSIISNEIISMFFTVAHQII